MAVAGMTQQTSKSVCKLYGQSIARVYARYTRHAIYWTKARSFSRRDDNSSGTWVGLHLKVWSGCVSNILSTEASRYSNAKNNCLYNGKNWIVIQLPTDRTIYVVSRCGAILSTMHTSLSEAPFN
jgi:hypothetical protein